MDVHQQMQAAIIDEGAPRPDGYEAHLAGCDACRDFATSHRVALRLKGAPVTLDRRRSLAEVKRRTGVIAGLSLILFGLAGLALRDGPVEPPAPLATGVELEPMQVIEEQPSDLVELAQLQAHVTATLTGDPREDELLTRAFGSLPRWVAPTRTQPMRALGTAISTLSYTTEDSP